jgi:hypothetical protein
MIAAVIHPDVEKNISAIRALCAELGVTRLELCEGDAELGGTPASSCFIVTTPETENPGLWAGKLVELEERLSSLLGREVDLLLPGALRNDWVRDHIAKSRTELYTVRQ